MHSNYILLVLDSSYLFPKSFPVVISWFKLKSLVGTNWKSHVMWPKAVRYYMHLLASYIAQIHPCVGVLNYIIRYASRELLKTI